MKALMLDRVETDTTSPCDWMLIFGRGGIDHYRCSGQHQVSGTAAAVLHAASGWTRGRGGRVRNL